MAKITRRKLLAAGGTAAAGVAGVGLTDIGGKKTPFLADFIPHEKNIGKPEAERRAEQNLMDARRTEEAESALQDRAKEQGYSFDAEDYEGNGRLITDNFLIGPNDSGQDLDRNVNGDSPEFTHLEGTDPYGEGTDAGDIVDDLLDFDDDDESEIALSEDQKSSVENEVEEFGDLALYTRENSDDQPILSDDVLEDLREEKETLDRIVNDYIGFLNGDGAVDGQSVESPHEVLESSEELEDNLESAGTQVSTEIAGFELWGTEYDQEEDLNLLERDALLEGEDQYSDRGIEDTTDLAEKIFERATENAAKTALMSNILGYALRESDKNAEVYGEGKYDETGETPSPTPTEEPTETPTETPTATPTETAQPDYTEQPPEECGIDESEVVEDLQSAGYDVSADEVFYEERGDDLEVRVDLDGDDALENPLEYDGQCSASA